MTTTTNGSGDKAGLLSSATGVEEESNVVGTSFSLVRYNNPVLIDKHSETPSVTPSTSSKYTTRPKVHTKSVVCHTTYFILSQRSIFKNLLESTYIIILLICAKFEPDWIKLILLSCANFVPYFNFIQSTHIDDIPVFGLYLIEA